jgi:hypothetical protein
MARSSTMEEEEEEVVVTAKGLVEVWRSRNLSTE